MSQFIRRPNQIFYGWWIVVAGMATMALSSGLFFTGFGFFFEPIRQTFGWSRTMLSGAYAVSRIQSAGMGPLVGYLIQKYEPRTVMTLAFIMFGLGFMLLSQTNSALTFYLFFLILSTGADPPGFLSVMASINNWFNSNRSKAIGFAMLGLGVGGIIFPPILAYGLDNFSWRITSFVSGVFIIIVGTAISQLVRFNPEPYGYFPDGIQIKNESYKAVNSNIVQNQKTASPPELELKEAIRTRAFWIISIGHAQALLVIASASLHQVPFMEINLELSRNSVAQIVMILTAFNMFGQMFGGFLGDQLPKNILAAFTLLGHSLAMVILSISDSYLILILYAICQGLSWGIRTPVLTSMRGDYFGRGAFALIMGCSQGIAMLGMVLGPLVVGYVADNYSYPVGFNVMALLTAPGALLFLLLKKPGEQKSLSI